MNQGLLTRCLAEIVKCLSGKRSTRCKAQSSDAAIVEACRVENVTHIGLRVLDAFVYWMVRMRV
jgi:hypothetical protein